jgi:hypothetical protein
MWEYIYIIYCVVVALLYTKYYLKEHKYQSEFLNLSKSRIVIATVFIFLIALAIAPFIMVASLYDKITY